MKSMRHLATGVSVIALAATASFSTSALAHHQLIPLGARGHIGPMEAPFLAPAKSKSGKWTDLKGLPSFSGGPDTMELRTDGSVFVYDGCAGQWWTLTPDKKGNYSTGTWSSKPSVMPSGYAPLFFGAQILTDGRMIMNGGEYNNTGSGCSGVWTNKGALYDPVKDSWTTVAPPSGWASIGDAQSIILADGSYMLAECCGESQAIASISGTTVTWTSTGTGKADDDDEEGYTALPGGDVLTVDVWKVTTDSDNWELYNPSKGTWTSEGNTPDLLTTTTYRELGPAVLTPQAGKSGTVIQFTGNSASGVNDIFDVASQKWTSGPIMMVGSTVYDDADAPAALLPDGNVITQASPGTYSTPSHFWELKSGKKGFTATQVNDTTTAPNDSSYYGRFLELPNGQLLWDNSGEVQGVTPEVATYTPKGKPKAAWLPVVSSVSSKLKVGSTANAISGTNFNGFSLGASYGDDAQMATNFPIVRITNTKTGDVCFGRSYSFSTMGVWTSGTTNAVFDLPKSCETGASTLQVVVNGLASAGVSVTLS